MKILKKINNVVLLLIAIVLLNSCSESDALNTNSSFEISTGKIYPNFDLAIKDYHITSLNTSKNINVTINDFNISKKCYINNIRVVSKITSIKLNPGEDIVIKLNNNSESTYTVHYLPEDMPKINLITKNNPTEGLILVNLFELSPNQQNGFNYIAILNNNGFPVYYRQTPEGSLNFKYFENENLEKRFSYNNTSEGKIILMNEDFEEIKQLKILPHNGHESYPTDNHDFIYFDDNHYILPCYYIRENVDMTAYGGSNSVDLVEFLFQEIQNNQVIFEWNTADHPELLNATDPIYYSLYATAAKVDYFHFNSINIDPNDHNFILSARHTNQVYKINRTTGAIIWRFGGNNDDFNLTGNEIISHQHYASILNNGNLLLFDNGVTKTPQQTRIAEFAINETNMSANLIFQYTEVGRFSDITGSAQKLNNGNYFIGWGGNITSQVNANKSDITEINSNGNIVLDISFSNNSNSFSYSYRALKYNISFND